MCHREAFHDVENLPHLPSTPTSALPQIRSNPASTCNLPELKPTADVIGNNQKLLQSTSKPGRLAVKLARESYFGEEVMKVSTVSSLPRDKGKVVCGVRAIVAEVSYFYRQSMSGTETERQSLALLCIAISISLMCIVLMYSMLYCVNCSYPITELSGGL